jgi:hypothetical protein
MAIGLINSCRWNDAEEDFMSLVPKSGSEWLEYPVLSSMSSFERFEAR